MTLCQMIVSYQEPEHWLIAFMSSRFHLDLVMLLLLRVADGLFDT